MNSENGFSNIPTSTMNDFKQDSLDIYSRYSTILSGFDPPGSFSEDTWLFVPPQHVPSSSPTDDKTVKSACLPSILHDQLTEDANSPSVAHLKRSLLTHLRQKNAKVFNSDTSSINNVDAAVKPNAATTTAVFKAEGENCRKSEENRSVSLQTERQFEQLNSMQDVIDVEITAKMQEEYLQRSVFEITKKLEECQCHKANASLNMNISQTASDYSSNGLTTSRYSKPGKVYNIRSNTQTLRVSPTKMHNQSTPIRPVVKYANRSITQTLRISPIARNKTRTLSVPRKQAFSKPMEISRSPTRRAQLPMTNTEAYLRLNGYNETNSVSVIDTNQSRSNLGSRHAFTSADRMKRSMSSGTKAYTVNQSRATNIVKCINGLANSEITNERVLAKPSFLPRLKPHNFMKRKFNAGPQPKDV